MPGRLRCARVALLLLCGSMQAAFAQRSSFSAVLMVPGRTSPFLADWERNPQFATLSVSYSGTTPSEYTLAAEVRGATRGVISRSTSGPYQILLGPTTQLVSSTQLACFSAENVQSFVDQIVRTGIIPEDRYTLDVRVLDAAGNELARASQSFLISLPEPPRLIFPANNATLLTAQPMFQWSPVQVPPEIGISYSVRVAELYDQQTPDAAIRSNPPVFDGSVDNVATLLYPLDALPLEDGRRYVWQVEARDGNGSPITSARRRSELWTFVRGTGLITQPITELLPDTVPLLNGVLQLTGIRRTTAREATRQVLLNGNARLELLGSITGNTDVRLSQVALDRDALPEAIVLSGDVAGNFNGSVNLSRFVRLHSFSYRPDRGARLTAQLALPGRPALPLDGDLGLSIDGPYGTLTARSAAWRLDGPAVSLLVSNPRVTMPEASVSLTGQLQLFGQNACGNLRVEVDSAGGLNADVGCPASFNAPLTGSAPLPRIHVVRVDGSVNSPSGSTTLVPALRVVGELHLDLTGRCTAVVELSITGAGVQTTRFEPRCSAVDNALDLGWLSLRPSNLAMERFNYQSGSGFDFALRFDAQLEFPAFPNTTFPTYIGIALGPSGVQMPELSGSVVGSLNVAGFRVQPEQARSSPVTVPWPEWASQSIRALRIAVGGTFSAQPIDPAAPPCLSSAIPVTAQLSIDGLSADIASQSLAAGCIIALGNVGTALELQRIGGTLRARLQPSITLESAPNVWASLRLPSFFRCTDATRSLSLNDAPLSLAANGGIAGRVSGLSPACSLELAAVALTINNATLDLGTNNGAGVAQLAGNAQGSFASNGQPVNGSGSVVIDLVEGRLRSGRVTFAGPFALGLPRVDPVLNLQAPRAELDSTGLRIDGRGELAIENGSPIGVTYNSLVVNPLDFGVSEGDLNFDSPFALRLTLGNDRTIAWKAVPLGTASGTAPAARIDLPTGSKLTAKGLVAAGTSAAAIAYDVVDLPAGMAQFSDDFALRVAPFGVGTGRVDLLDGSNRLAYVDWTGFHPDQLTLAGLPEQLPLPSIAAAYLDLSGQLRPIATERRSDGTIRVFTNPNTTVALVLPGLGDPVLRVPVSVDVIVEPTGKTVRSGSINGIPSGLDLSTRGLPFVIDRLGYLAEQQALIVEGRPVVLGEPRGAVASARLFLDAQTRLSGLFSTPTRDLILIHPGARRFAFVFDSIGGQVDALLTQRNVQFSFDGHGTLELSSGGEAYRTHAALTSSQSGLTFSHVDQIPIDQPTAPVSVGPLMLTFSNVRVEQLTYTAGAWDFALLVDADIGFTALPGVDLPDQPDLRLTPRGLSVPAFTVPEIHGAAQIPLNTFVLQPLALRSSAGSIDWFTETASGTWGLAVDLALSMPLLNGGLKGTQLSVLDAKLEGDHFKGTIEPLTLPAALDVRYGNQGGALRVSALSGAIGDAVTVRMTAALVPPSRMDCPSAQAGAIPFVNGITLSGDGTMTGSTSTAGCTLTFGSLKVAVNSGNVVLAGRADTVDRQHDGVAAAAERIDHHRHGTSHDRP
jgi:hypothetical protein